MTCNVIVWFNDSLFLAFLFFFSLGHKCIKCIWRKLNRPGEMLSTCIFSYTATCTYNFWWGKKLANLFSFASGSQYVTKSNLMIIKLIKASQRGYILLVFFVKGQVGPLEGMWVTMRESFDNCTTHYP